MCLLNVLQRVRRNLNREGAGGLRRVKLPPVGARSRRIAAAVEKKELGAGEGDDAGIANRAPRKAPYRGLTIHSRGLDDKVWGEVAGPG
jgi:hypothetical protein